MVSVKKGFTLIEVLVAIAVITTISFAPFAIIAQRLIENSLAEDRVRASLMAQEVIEYVHFTRDQSILDADAGNWFTNLRSDEGSFSQCTTYVEDVATRPNATYCTVTCKDDGGRVAACTGKNGFVTGVSGSAGTRGSSEKTCDGVAAQEGGVFTVTLSITVPREEADVQYATIDSCVSWEGTDEMVRKIEAQETVFEWVLKK